MTLLSLIQMAVTHSPPHNFNNKNTTNMIHHLLD